jgi:GTP cyclohydrolase I
MRPSRQEALAAVRTLLAYAGEDPAREGLLETPNRVVKAYDEDWFTGYDQDPAEVIKAFNDGGEDYDGMLFQGSIPVTTFCEHHQAQIFGYAHFAYIPDGRIVGLSKISRLIDVFARRLQVQERLTRQVINAFNQHVPCRGCGVLFQLRHMCMEGRGIRQHRTVTTSAALRGIFLEERGVKEEFMAMVRMENSRP